MIRPDGFKGAAFGGAAEGDLRFSDDSRRSVASELGVSPEWAFASQVHSATVIHATQPGSRGEADALFVTRQALPVAVATADCVPVILEGDGVAAVVHAGWRGAAAGVVPATLKAIEHSGHAVQRAAIGPSIRSCCYEVGSEVVAQFDGFVSQTSWGTPSIDIAGYIANQLDGIELWQSPLCTYTERSLHSFRRNRTKQRQVAVAWLPPA